MGSVPRIKKKKKECAHCLVRWPIDLICDDRRVCQIKTYRKQNPLYLSRRAAKLCAQHLYTNVPPPFSSAPIVLDHDNVDIAFFSSHPIQHISPPFPPLSWRNYCNKFNTRLAFEYGRTRWYYYVRYYLLCRLMRGITSRKSP